MKEIKSRTGETELQPPESVPAGPVRPIPMGNYAEEDRHGVVWVYLDRRVTHFMARRDWDQIVASLGSKATLHK